MNREIKELKENCVQLESRLHEVAKSCNRIGRILEHATWEKDMERQDLVVFTGSTHEFLDLLAPLIRSGHCKVNGKMNREALLRAVDEVIKVRFEAGKGFLKFGSLLDAAKRYFSEE